MCRTFHRRTGIFLHWGIRLRIWRNLPEQPAQLCSILCGVLRCVRNLDQLRSWSLPAEVYLTIRPGGTRKAVPMSRRKSRSPNYSGRMGLLESHMFVGGVVLLAIAIFLFAGVTAVVSSCPPHLDVNSVCTDRSLPWLALLGLPFGIVMVAYPFFKGRAFSV